MREIMCAAQSLFAATCVSAVAHGAAGMGPGHVGVGVLKAVVPRSV